MLQYFIQVTENLLATAILWALLFAAVLRTGEPRFRKWFVRLSLAASGAALVLAVLRRTTALVNRSYVNAGTLSLALLAGILCIVFLLRGKRPGGKAPAYSGFVPALLGGLLLFYALPTIFLYPPEFALPGEPFFSTDALFKFIGFAGGLALVLLSAVAVFNAARQSPGMMERCLALALVVNMLSQATVMVQFLFARRIIPVILWLFKLMVLGINHSRVFLFAIMGISLAIPLSLFLRSVRGPDREGVRNPAELRKRRAALRGQRRWCAAAAAGYVLALLTVTALKSYNERGFTLSPAEPMTIQGGEIIIPLEQVMDGHLHRFAYTAEENIEMRFIVIKKSEAAYGVGLDACDICGPTGYYERKDQVICRLCDVIMNKSTIGFKGGCNPVPLRYTTRSGNMIIALQDLENERNRFK